jgi:hypothetical protein
MQTKSGIELDMHVKSHEYWDGEGLIKKLGVRSVWHTKTAHPANDKTFVEGVPMAHASYEKCPVCKKIDLKQIDNEVTQGLPCYTVWSYNTAIWQQCMLCGYEMAAMKWYSYTTRALQRHIARVSLHCLICLQNAEAYEDRAREYWEERKKAKTLPPPQIKKYNGSDPVYYKLRGLKEKIKLYKDNGGK